MTRTLRLAVVTAALVVLALSYSANAFAAADPDHVTFTHEGCRLVTTTTLPNSDGKFVCTDAEYTPGNLGKNWNELDNVPHRLTAANGGPDQTYTVTITADNKKGSFPGYDVISIPVLNKRLSTGGDAGADSNCSLDSVDPDAATSPKGGELTPGVGGMDVSLYRKLTISQKAGATCVFDWYARLALGSHLFPGSSLHTNLLNQSFTSAGIGSKDVSIPVKEILPQELGKTMSAHQGASYGWDVQKTGTPAVNLNNTCFPNAPHSASVTSTITWTRTAPAPNGQITVSTTITITNPSHRDVIANVTDTVKSGSSNVTALGAGETNPKVFAPVTVHANSTETLTNTIHVASGTTNLNDVAQATYTDPVDATLTIPGNTQATASANVETSNTINQTATIVDNESISGDPSLSYSIDQIDNEPAGSSVTAPAGYAVGTHQRVTSSTWQSGTIDPGAGNTDVSGSITFHKTIYVSGSVDISSASLDDTATLTDSGTPPATPSADWSTAITASSDCASIEIVKTHVAPDVYHDGDNVTYLYAVSNPSSNTGSITDVVVSDDKCANVQGPVSKTGGNDDDRLDPGETWNYTCTTPANHAFEDSSHVITNVATASGLNPIGELVSDQDDDHIKVIHPAIKIDKTGPATAQAGDKISYVLTVTNPGDTPLAASTLVVSDPQCNGDPVTLLSKNGDGSPDSFDPGDVWTYTCSLQTGSGDTSVENHATAEGKDQLGKVVDSASVAATVLNPPQQVVLGARVTPGAARLAGPSGCQSRAFNARIRGSRIATVTFALDGKVVKKVRNTKNAKLIQLRVNPSKLKLGVHRLVVTVTFQSGSNTKPKTFRLSFQRCGKKLISPRFTG
jgi:uncharacterized repeat protein (TIGR01451 family)